MIVDTASNIGRYASMSEDFKKVAELLASVDFAAIETGMYTVEGSGVYYMVQEPTLKTRENAKWEVHNKYIDVQYNVGGTVEIMDYAPRASFDEFVFPEDSDVAFSSQEPVRTEVNVEEGSIVVFFPEDAHRPGMGDGSAKYRKVVFKVPVF